MATAVSLVDFRPTARHDEVAWTKARIEQSLNFEPDADEGSGDDEATWTTIDTITLDPVECHPHRPAARTLVTREAVDPAGWLRVVFFDDDDLEDEPSQVAAVSHPIFRPTVRQVETILRARTYSDGGEGIGAGGLVGEFSESTVPSADDVRNRLIPEACREVAISLGRRPPGVYLEDVRRVAALRTAAEIERSHIPEQADEGRATIYQTLRLTANELTDKVGRNIDSFLLVERGIL